MTDDQVQQLADVSAGMTHVLTALKELKDTVAELRRDFVSRPHYESEIASLKQRLLAVEEAARKSPFDAITRFFTGVTVVVGGMSALYLVAQYVVKHG